MSRIRVLIADDEPLAREGLAMLASRDAEVELVGACPDGSSALEAIRERRPDLVFLDIQMPRPDGIELLRSLRPEERPAVVFVTAYHEYAIQAFEMCAVDYLLKPFDDDRFRSALARAKEGIRRSRVGDIDRRLDAVIERIHRLESAGKGAGGEARPRIAFKVGGEYLLVSADDLVWIEARGDFVQIRADGQIRQVRETLQGVEKRLDPRRFARVHRSFIVNLGSIRRIAPTFYGDYDLLMSDGIRIRLARSYRDRLRSLLPPREGQGGGGADA